MSEDTLADIQAFIEQAFEENFELLSIENGHGISAEAKAAALQQVLLYWRKLRDVAERVTDTEVRLTLPGQRTPKGREYAIEGVVDIVREDDRVVMYDVKTHEADYVRANLDLYRRQLNVYAHIWQELRGQPLDSTAIIATDFPRAVKEALSNPDPRALEAELAGWQPLIPIEYDPANKDQTLLEFGRVVDAIEDGQFAPPPPDRLRETIPGALTHERFGTRICRNCDARFSCDSYRHFARGTRKFNERSMTYFVDPNPDQEEWLTAGLEG